jgi:hypothetical protein
MIALQLHVRELLDHVLPNFHLPAVPGERLSGDQQASGSSALHIPQRTIVKVILIQERAMIHCIDYLAYVGSESALAYASRPAVAARLIRSIKSAFL